MHVAALVLVLAADALVVIGWRLLGEPDVNPRLVTPAWLPSG